MTLPRRVIPGQTYMLTRRSTQRQLLLTPSEVVEQVLTYSLGVAAQRYSIDVFCFVVMGNHYHLEIGDPHGKVPRFMAMFNSLVARALNVAYDRAEAFWSSGPYSAVVLGDDDAMLDKIVYTITNPVAAGLVDRAEQWPGVVTLPTDLCGGRELVAEKPSFFFRRERVDAADHDAESPRPHRRRKRRDLLPDKVSVRLVRPPCFPDLSDDEFRKLVARRVEERIAEIMSARRREGKHRTLGRAAIRRQRPGDSPASSSPRFAMNPRVACKDKWRRIEMLETQSEFWREHQEASRRFRAARGRAARRRVVFPEGTYWYRVHFGARCRSSTAA